MNQAACTDTDPAMFEAKRSAPRTNLFLMATIVTSGTIRPVRIRNLSARGALIESRNLPGTGAALTLRRGNVTVEGRLMWADEHRGGMSFDAPTDVSDWLPFGPGLSRGQARVDRIIAKTRDDLVARTDTCAADPIDESRLRQHVREELEAIARNLDAVGMDLAPMTGLAPQAVEIQVAVQTVGHLCRLLGLDSEIGVQQAIDTEKLRRRLDQRARRG